jgi:hypothetical protein
MDAVVAGHLTDRTNGLVGGEKAAWPLNAIWTFRIAAISTRSPGLQQRSL